MGLSDYGLGSQPTDTPTVVNTGSVTCMLACSQLYTLVPRQQSGGRGPIVPGNETSESGTPFKGNLEERIKVGFLREEFQEKLQ